MKKILLSISLLTMTIGHILAQGPTIKLVGGSPSLAKGTINTEVLTAIIQQKQEEVKRKVFRNTIVKGFNYSNEESSLKNFTTYHYLYNVMDDLTSGKNKTAITKSLTESSTEFAYIFGLAFYYKNYASFNKASAKTFGDYANNETVFSDAKAEFVKGNVITGKVEKFNMLLDICYDVILEDKTIKQTFNFKEDLTEKEFKSWYESDNYYFNTHKGLVKEIANLTAITNPNADTKKLLVDKKQELTDLEAYRADVKLKLADLLELIEKYKNVSDDIINIANEIKTLKNSDAKELLNSLSNLNIDNIKTKLQALQSETPTVLTPEQIASITKVITLLDANYSNYKNLITFFGGLQKSNFKDFTLTKEQYYSMKFLIVEFLEVAKNQYENDVVATVIDFMLENTLVEFSDPSGNPQPEDAATKASDKGYLYIDVESLISAIDQKFSPTNKKGLGVYVTPFFSIGTNYASFLNSNSLTVDDIGAAKSLSNLYYASEKIGIKWKLWNWKYTHSFEAGQNFKYFNQTNIINPWAWHGKNWKYATTNRWIGGRWNPFNWGKYWNPNRYWLRPQPKPLLSDIHIIAYGSGLLYNIANLKSESQFNYAVAGVGLGLTFFNGLAINASLACPYTDNKFNSNNTFFNFGLDIPIIEYIGALTKKN
jgi:hypothetical protein